jgi:hypothetical protein
MIGEALPPTNIFMRPCGLVPLSICRSLVASSGLPESCPRNGDMPASPFTHRQHGVIG